MKPRIRLRTAERALSPTDKAIRQVMRERLTRTQYRRVALLFGFDGPPMTQDRVAAHEGVSRASIRRAKFRATARLGGDWRAWVLWLTTDYASMRRDT